MTELPSVSELVAAYQELGSIRKVADRYGGGTKKIGDVLKAAGALSNRGHYDQTNAAAP